MSHVQRNRIDNLSTTTRVNDTPLLRGSIQLLWLAVAVIILGLHVFGLPTRIEHLRLVLPIQGRLGQLDIPQATVLTSLGFPAQLYYLWVLTSELAMMSGAFVVAALAFIRRRDDWPALLFSMMILALVCSNTNFTRALADNWRWVFWLRRWLQALGLALLLPIFCSFPDGRFMPRWTRWLCIVWVGQVALWLANLAPLSPLPGGTIGDPAIVGGIYLFSWIGVGIAVLWNRLRRAAAGVERQQLLWTVGGIVAATGAAFLSYMAEGVINWLGTIQTPEGQMIVLLTTRPLYYFATALIVPMFIGPALLRYGLWGFRPLLTRTAIFIIITATLITMYLGLVGAIGWLFGYTSTSSTVSAALAAALAALVFAPLRRWLQHRIDRRLYRDRIDLRQGFDALGDQLRTMFDQQQIAHALAERTVALLHAEHAEVLLQNSHGAFVSTAATGPHHTPALSLRTLDQLARGEAVLGLARAIPLAVPIRSVNGGERSLVGVLLLGSHRSERPYDQEQLRALLGLGNHTGDALTIAQAVQNARVLEAYRASPAGQAEALAAELVARPATAVAQLRLLAGNPAQHSVVEILPAALRQTGANNLAHVAELLTRLSDPALAASALDSLPAALAAFGESGHTAMYRALAAALRCEHVAALVAWQPPKSSDDPLEPVCVLLQAAAQSVAAALPPADAATQLAGLSRAAGQLRHRVLVAAPDTLVAALVAEHWRAIIDTTRRTVQGSAQLVCTLVTRQVLAAPTVSLLVELRNHGAATATDIAVTLEGSVNATPSGAPVAIKTLAPEATVRVDLPIMITGSLSTLPLTLQVRYTDPSGADQTLHTQAWLALLEAPLYVGELDNPFIPGTPLEPTSPVFVGRADDLAWICAHAASRQPLPLLITGQRRMGKTTLLLRLTHHLADTHLVVFADGQGLAIDQTPNSLFEDLAALLLQAADLPLPSATTSARAFLHTVLPAVVAAVAPRRVLVLLDEFEELEHRLRTGRFGIEVFGMLRHIAQHVPNIQTVLVGGNRPAALADPVWTGLLNVALHRRVSALDDAAARALIACAPLTFDDQAREAVLALAGGHPYILQLCCHTLVNEANYAQRTYVLPEHVAKMADMVLVHGEAHFASLWAEADLAEQHVLATLAKQHATVAHASLDRAAIDRLVGRELLICEHSDQEPLWRLALLGRWIRRNR